MLSKAWLVGDRHLWTATKRPSEHLRQLAHPQKDPWPMRASGIHIPKTLNFKAFWE